MSGLEPSYENIIKQDLEIADLKRAYHTLMGQAVRFAERLNMYQDSNVLLMRHRDVDEFLASPDVLKWREQEGKK